MADLQDIADRLFNFNGRTMGGDLWGYNIELGYCPGRGSRYASLQIKYLSTSIAYKMHISAGRKYHRLVLLALDDVDEFNKQCLSVGNAVALLRMTLPAFQFYNPVNYSHD